MPISAREKDVLQKIFRRTVDHDDPHEIIALAGLIYQTILQAKLPSDQLMLMGKMIYAQIPWHQVDNKLRVNFVTAARDFLLPQIPQTLQLSDEIEEDTIVEAMKAEGYEPKSPLPEGYVGPSIDGQPFGDPDDDGSEQGLDAAPDMDEEERPKKAKKKAPRVEQPKAETKADPNGKISEKPAQPDDEVAESTNGP